MLLVKNMYFLSSGCNWNDIEEMEYFIFSEKLKSRLEKVNFKNAHVLHYLKKYRMKIILKRKR